MLPATSWCSPCCKQKTRPLLARQAECALLCHALRAAVHQADRNGAAVARACVPVQETVPFDDVVGGLDATLTRSEHVRLWRYPQSQQRGSNNQSSGTSMSSVTSGCPKASSRSLHPASSMMRLPPCSRPSFWRALHTVHLVELLLFIARWPPWLTYYIARCTLWMDSARKVTFNDNTSILNLNCRVRNSSILTNMPDSNLTCRSARFYSPVPTIHG